ncbi:MAG: Na/Pi cotransporter family protein [Lachnospiraceae bacterium]|nr:Na/Pi cotransporter family protein [Lachnospiraceae bacterium]
MSFTEIIELISGISLFLFGMSLMGDGLKKLSGNKLEPILYRLSNTKPKAVLLGTGVTAVIQSSCATSVMVVGFVNSGMMKVRQGINVILGAILGTSITGWILCLSYIEGGGGLKAVLSTSTLTGIVAVTGILLRMLGKNQGTKNTGDILLGFSVLMIGMKMMSESVGGLGDSPYFINAISSLSNPFLGIITGALFTALLQSASAAVGILQALSVTGAMSFESTLPLLLGVVIGAAAPVMLSSIGANVAGKRTALVYPVAAVLGVVFFSVVFYIVEAVIRFQFWDEATTPFSIAMINTLVRLVILFFLIPFTGIIESIVSTMIKDRTPEKAPQIHLEERFISYPALAVEQSHHTINDMAHISDRALSRAISLFTGYDGHLFDKIADDEGAVNKYEDAIGSYLVKVSGQELSPQQNMYISLFLQILPDFERIANHALNLAGNAREVAEKEVVFSPGALEELDSLFNLLQREAEVTLDSFIEEDGTRAEETAALDAKAKELCERMKNNHIARLQRGECTIQNGFIFNDITNVCERISNHYAHISEAVSAIFP